MGLVGNEVDGTPADLTGRYLVTLTVETSAAPACRRRCGAYVYRLDVRGQTEENFRDADFRPGEHGRGSPVPRRRCGSRRIRLPACRHGLSVYCGGHRRARSTGRIGGALRGDWIYCPRSDSQRPWGCPRSVAKGCNSHTHQILLSAREELLYPVKLVPSSLRTTDHGPK